MGRLKELTDKTSECDDFEICAGCNYHSINIASKFPFDSHHSKNIQQ